MEDEMTNPNLNTELTQNIFEITTIYTGNTEVVADENCSGCGGCDGGGGCGNEG